MTSDLEEQAAYWHAAQDAEDMDWVGFTAWLEADPRHRTAFNDMLLLDDDVVAQRGVIAGHLDRDDLPKAKPRWPWALGAGGAIAAGLALFLTLPRSTDTVWQTGGTARTIAFSDGTRATLAPRTRLAALGGDATRLSLNGSAFFDVPHRFGRQLTITAGDYAITDIGTRFDVTTDQAATRVTVAQGTVNISSASLDGTVPITAGRGFIARAGVTALVAQSPSTVGSWRNGILTYREMPLALVAADITRYSGVEVTIDPTIADRRFLGTLTIGDGSKLATTVAQIMHLNVRRDGRLVRLEPRR